MSIHIKFNFTWFVFLHFFKSLYKIIKHKSTKNFCKLFGIANCYLFCRYF